MKMTSKGRGSRPRAAAGSPNAARPAPPPCRPVQLGQGCRGRPWPRSSPARALVRSWAPGQQVSWGKSPFGRMGRLHYRTCVRVQGAVPPVVPVAAGAGGAGGLDPMLDRLLAVEVAGLPDEALAADLVGLRVAVSRLESEFARRLVVFDRRGAAGVTGAVSTAAWLRGACRLSAGEAGERVR